MTSWKEERDRLVAQTLAFVQQVAASHPAAASKLGLRSAQDRAPVDAGIIAPSPETIDLQQTMAGLLVDDTIGNAGPPAPANIRADLPRHASRYATASERSDISDRVAAFKARQTMLNTEREAYYDNMQARIRSALRNDTDGNRL